MTACDSPWVYFKSNCYFFSIDAKENIQARNACNEQNALLAKIDNQEELDFITSLTKYDDLRFNKYFIEGVCTGDHCIGTSMTMS